MWNALSDGAGGIDWAGVPLWAATLGVEDVEGLMHRLVMLKLYRAPKDREQDDNG